MGAAGQKVRLEKGQLWWTFKPWGDGRGALLRVTEVWQGGRSGEVQRLDPKTLEPEGCVTLGVSVGRVHVVVREGKDIRLTPWQPDLPNFQAHADKLARLTPDDLGGALAHLDRMRLEVLRYHREKAGQAPEKPQGAVEVAGG